MTCWLCGFETTKFTTNAEAPTCTNGPCQICIAVSNIDEEINQAVVTLRRLLAKRCDLRSEQNRVHGTLIHRLPTELKSEIFQLLFATQNEWGEFPIVPSSESTTTTTNEWGGVGGSRFRVVEPAILSYISVCRNWRDIALSNPLLWSTIQIKLIKGKASSDPSSGRVNFVRDHILRAQSLPLTLHIYAREVPEEEWKDLIDFISQSSNRWHSLSLDISPSLLRAFHRSNFQCRLLKNLRMIGDANGSLRDELVPLSNFSPEKVEIVRIHFQSIPISWNHLTSAKVIGFDFGDLKKLFQHASQMTYCYISDAYDDGSIPLIIHHRLKKLEFVEAQRADDFLEYLTLPCLEEFHVEQMFLLEYLPALVHRSSCPLSRVTFNLKICEGDSGWDLPDYLDLLPGVTDLVVQNVEVLGQVVTIQELLLEDFFPDLCRLTIRLEPFRFLWDEGVIPLLLDPKQLYSDGRKILVIDQNRTREARNVGKQLKALGLDVSLRKDGFEILMPCVNTDLLASHLPLQLAVG